jgi:hypothetical protein
MTSSTISDPTATERSGCCIFVANVSTDAIVDNLFPVEGNMRRIAKFSGRGLGDIFTRSTPGASTDEESKEEAASSSFAENPREGADAILSFVGEC